MSTITHLSDRPRKVTLWNLHLKNGGAQIHRFWENITELREIKRKWSDEIERILTSPPKLESIPSKSEIRPLLEHAMIVELKNRGYALRYESLEAIRHIGYLIMRFLYEKSWMIVMPTGQDYGREKISAGDQNVLHYVFGTHPKAPDVYRILRQRIEIEYGKIGDNYENTPDNKWSSIAELFREIQRITPHILDTLVETLDKALSLPRKWIVSMTKKYD